MMSRADLESKLLPIETIRGGTSIRAAMTDAAERADVLVCDAETEEDLAALAQASLEISVDPVWAGSAGLIGHLLDAADVSRQKPTLPQPMLSAGPLLFVVGSLSSVSRRQAERLAKEDIVVLAIEEAMLNNNGVCVAALVDRLAAALATGKDVLLLSTPKAVLVAPRRRRALHGAARLDCPSRPAHRRALRDRRRNRPRRADGHGSNDIEACRRNRTRCSAVGCGRATSVSRHHQSRRVRRRLDDAELPARSS